MVKYNMDIKVIDKQLDVLIRDGNFGAIADLCRSVLSVGEKDLEPQVHYRLAVIGGFALFQLNKFQESGELLLPLYDSGFRELDLLFLLIALHFIQAHYEKTITFGEEFLLKFEEIKIKRDYAGLTDAHLKVHEICNNLGTACIKLGRNEKAIEFFKKGIEFKKGYSLLYENLAAVNSFSDRWNEAGTAVKEGLQYCQSNAELHRVHGVVLQHLHRYHEAKKSLETAVTLGSFEALSELGILCQLMSQFKESVPWLDKYLSRYPENSPLKDLRDKIENSEYYARKEPAISVTMIVKNEEEMLGQCLESVLDVADELVVVDTGSTDKTVEIAHRYGAKVFHHPWQDSFSEARNYSISKATGDWILIIDADEVLEKADILKARELKWHDEYECFCFAVYSQLPGYLGGVSHGKHYSPRLFKRREDIIYEGIVHNVLRMPTRTCMTEVGIYHYGYDLRKEKMEQKFHRSLELLLKQVKDKPEDPFVRFNLAQMYLSRDYCNEAKEHAEKIVSLLSPDNKKQVHILLMGLYQLALIHIRSNEFDKAKEYCKTALEIKPNYIDPLLTLGWINFEEKKYKQSLTVLQKFIKHCDELNKGSDFNMIVLNKLGSVFEAYYIIGEIYRRQERFADARSMLTKSSELNPYYWQTYKSLGMIAVREHEDQDAGQLFEQGIKLGYLNAEKYGTTGAPRNEFAELLEEYKKVLFRHIDDSHETEKVESALAKIDELLK